MTVTQDLLQSLLPEVTAIALKAGAAILKISVERSLIEKKEDGSPLTLADMASHNAIVSGLAALKTQFPVISEEADPEALSADAVYWLVDPLDGTKEFLAQNGDYTVNIALVENGVPVLGVIYAPEVDDLYYAANGLGAWKRKGQVEAERIQANEATRPPVAVVSRSHPSEETARFLQAHGVANTIPRGSSVKICAVAEGTADVYPRLNPTWYWDTAAGAIIAREAGCRVETPTGEPLTYHPGPVIKHFGFVVSGPAFQQ